MKQEYIIDKEFRDMLISWFENIEDTCNKLTSGNVSHQGATIRNKAIRCTTFIKKYTKVEEHHTKKVEPIDGLSQDMYNILVSHCESKVKRLKDSMPWSHVYNEHRIFLELLKRVGRDFVEKEKQL